MKMVVSFVLLAMFGLFFSTGAFALDMQEKDSIFKTYDFGDITVHVGIDSGDNPEINSLQSSGLMPVSAFIENKLSHKRKKFLHVKTIHKHLAYYSYFLQLKYLS